MGDIEEALPSSTTIASGGDTVETTMSSASSSTETKEAPSVIRRHTTSATLSSMEESYEFVDYTIPPEPPLPPPAKYKLWLVVMFLVYFASWFSAEAGVVASFARSGYLNFHAALFCQLCIVVWVLVYAALDLLVACLTFQIRGKVFGLGAWLKAPRLAPKLQQYDNVVAEILAAVCKIFEEGFEIFNPPPPIPPQTTPKQYDCGNDDYAGSVVLKIEHSLKPNSWDAYRKWQTKICKLVNSQPGLVQVKACEPEGDRHVVLVTFTSIDALNDYMTSPARRKLMKKLEPLLRQPDTMQLQKDRKLPDAFTDLLTRQGECVPTLLPKKWKVWWLTSCGLFFVILIQEAVMPHYYTVWGLDDAHERLKAFVSVLFSTWFNSFVMTPFLIMIFSDWVKRKPGEADTKEPWHTLNDGLNNIWFKVFVTIAFYGGCVIAWAVKSK